MKFVLLAAVAIIAKAQYNVGSTGSVTLPGGPTGTQTGQTTTTINVDVPTFPTANLFTLTQGSTSSVATNANIANTIGNAQSLISTATDSFAALFTRHPSKANLEKFAADGDTAAILTTLKNLAADDSVPCGSKVAYLQELLGTVKGAIQRKVLAADELTSIINGAKAEIARLQDEIARAQRDRDALKIPDIEARIADLVARLQNLYAQINTVKSQIPPEQARIVGFENEISTLTRQNDDERNRISNDKLKLTQTDNLIRDLENRLKDARDQKAALEASIAASEGLIRDNNAKISNIRNTIADIQAKIKGLQDTSDRLRRDANTLEVDLERARTDFSVAQVKDRKLQDDINNFKNRIADQQPKLVEDDLNNLKVLINKLNGTLPSIQSEIDREYYFCYGAGKVSTETTGNTIVYVVKGEAFGTYIQSAYGQSVWAPSLRTSGDYRLQVVDPFSPAWTSKFGYSNVFSGSGSGLGSCFTGRGSSSGRGVISSISNTGFVVKDAQGNNVNLSINPCSRIESTTAIPSVGQTAFWAGEPSGNGGYSIKSVTCTM